MTAVWRMELPPSEKMVLLALADGANDDGVTWMAIRSKTAGKLDFITKTSLSERTVQTCMKALEDRGLIHRKMVEGKGVIYTVLPEGCKSRTPANLALGGATAAPKPSSNHSPNGEIKKTRASKRCPDGWRPSPEDFQVSIDEGLTPGETERALAKFRDHTFASPRTDWSATFRNWIRRSAEERPRHDRTGSSPKLDHLASVASAMDAAFNGAGREHPADRGGRGDEGGSVVVLPLARNTG